MNTGKHRNFIDKIETVGPEIARKLNPYLLNFFRLGDKNLVAKVRPRILLNCGRFDLMAKYIYAKHRELGIDSDWGLRLYSEHIRVFNEYQEGDYSGKSDIGSFIDAFHKTSDSIKQNGFDANVSIIPVGEGNLMIDGAHRAAACLLYNKEVDLLFFDTQAANYNYLYFRNKGLASKWADAMALEYCRLNDNTYMVTVFPSAVSKEEQVKQILEEHGSIFYEKSVYLIREGPVNLIRQMYAREPWLGDWNNDFAGARDKTKACFKYEGPTRISVFESNSLENANKAKSKIRNLFRIGNNSIHINTTHEETVKLAQILLNENSIHFLNYARLKNYGKFRQLLENYKKWLEEQSLDKEDFCIDGGSIMACYGIRETRDLDFLSHKYNDISTGHPDITSHNAEAHHHITTKDDIIYNPENHFYYEGIKFASPDIVRGMKEKRMEQKDMEDINLIDAWMGNKHNKKILLGFHSRLFFSRWGPYMFSKGVMRILQKLESKVAFYPKQIIKKILKVFGYRIMKVNTDDSADLGKTLISDSFSTPIPILFDNFKTIPGMTSLDNSSCLYMMAYASTIKGDIIEIGCWQGRTTCFLAQACKDSNNGVVHAIDHFRGNPGKEKYYVVSKEDLSDLKDNFYKNIEEKKLSGYVNIYAMSSEKALSLVKQKAKNVRMLFIDGDHAYEAVCQDIKNYSPLLLPGGLIAFHDYSSNAPGVCRALKELIIEGGQYGCFVQLRDMFVARKKL